jgi:demethylmenaquinone methyltransferase/2-methoxy-6-polyprenyl-1,4-benzoquinol methylase
MARDSCYPPGLLYDALLEPILRKIRKQIQALIIRDGLFPVLDLCCGPGGQVRWLAGRGRFSCGLDINFGMLRYAAGRGKNIPFVCADAVQTPFRAAAFKGIVVSFALHLKPAAFRPSLLAEARRLLKPEGRLVLVDFERPWDRASRFAYPYIWVIERLAGSDHFHNGREFLARGGLRSLLLKNDLKELERHDISAGTCAVVVAAPR